ncbi:hypothetical protein [Umezawaea beigongshangensis]|uniref:hypothetical protein n=1 Tax=Umezawaea beigongshangensis TaxID=2780383 RepID=UPI0018F1FD42|nr:hypothetical protein [Umezawaea beigongshangensis]
MEVQFAVDGVVDHEHWRPPVHLRLEVGQQAVGSVPQVGVQQVGALAAEGPLDGVPVGLDHLPDVGAQHGAQPRQRPQVPGRQVVEPRGRAGRLPQPGDLLQQSRRRSRQHDVRTGVEVGHLDVGGEEVGEVVRERCDRSQCPDRGEDLPIVRGEVAHVPTPPVEVRSALVVLEQVNAVHHLPQQVGLRLHPRALEIGAGEVDAQGRHGVPSNRHPFTAP